MCITTMHERFSCALNFLKIGNFMFYLWVLQFFHSVFLFPFQIDDIFGSTGVNGKENGSSATASQPNRVWKQCHTSFRLIFTFCLFLHVV